MINLKNCLFLSLGLMLVSCKDQGQKFDLESEALQDAVSQVNKRLEYQDTLLFSTYADDNKMINVPFTVKHDNTLVFKSSITNCETCFDSVMTLLIKGDWVGKVNLEIWIENPKVSKMLESKPWYSKNLNIVFRPIDGILLATLKSEKVNKPYFFVLNKQRSCVSNLFFPERESSTNTQKYLDIILDKYPKS